MSEEQRKIALQTEVDATGARQGLGDIKSAAQDMAQGVVQAGQTASKALDGIGAGAGTAADKLDRTTSNIVGSIQRATAAAQAGTKGTADYYDAIGKLKGADGAVLKPYIDKLREVELAQKSVNGALGAGAATMDASGMSAKQMAFALRGIPAQFTDIAVSLQSGQRPMTVLLQQGGQLKDMFGGIGPAARAMGGYIVGLVNPLTITAALVGGLGYAALLGAKELREFQNATILTGNAVGISNSQFTTLRDNLAGIATKGKAAEALTEIAKNGQIAGTNIMGIAEAAILMEKTAGQPIQKTIDLFKDLGDKPAEAALKANEGVNFLTASVYKQIKALEEQGKKADAATLATRALADEMKVRSAEITGNVGAIEGAWNGVLGVLKKVGDSLLNIGRQQSTAQKLAAVQGQIADATGQNPNKPFRMPWDTPVTDLRQQEANLQEQLRLEQRGAEAATARAAATRDTAEWEKLVDERKTKTQLRDQEIAKARELGQRQIAAGLITEKDLNEQIAHIRQKYLETSGASNVAQQRAAKLVAEEENARLLRSINTGDFSQPTKLTAAEQKVIQVQEELKEAMTTAARAYKQRELVAAQLAIQDEKNTQILQKQAEAVKAAKESHEKLVIATGAEADKIREQALEQQRANDMFGKSKTAIEQVRLAEMQKQLAEADAFDSFDPRYVASLKAKTDAQKLYVEQLQRAEFLQGSRKLDEQARAAGEEAKTLQLEVGLLGMAGLERAKIIAARKVEVALAKELADIEKMNLGEGPEAAAQREELRAKARANASIESQNAVQKAVLDEWQRTTDEINRSLTDALLRGFESGKDFAKNFRDTLKNMFQTLVLRPIIQGVLAPVSGALSGVTQSLTGSGGVLGAASNGYGLYNMGSKAADWLGIGGGSMSSASSAAVAGSAELYSSTAAYSATYESLIAAGADTAAAAEMAAGATTAMASETSALAAMGPYGWVAAAVLVAIAYFSGKGGGPKQDGRFGNVYTDIGSSDNSLGLGLAPSVLGIQTQYSALAKQFGGQAAVSFGLAISRDPAGTSATFLEIAATKNGSKLFSNLNRGVGRSDDDLKQAIATASTDAIIGALKASNLDQPFADFFDKVAGDATQEAKNAAIQTATNVAVYADPLKDLGGVFAQLSKLSVQARDSMIQAAGGLQALQQATGDYYQNFYSAEERRNITIARVSTTLQSIGLSLNGVDLSTASARDTFRHWVDALDLSTDAGRNAYVVLMGLSGVFASITPAVEDAVTGTSSAVESLNSARSNLTAAYGREKQALESVRDRMDGFVSKFKSFRDSLLLSDLSPLTPSQRYAEARNQFTKTVSDMSSPDATVAAAAMDRFDQVAQSFLTTSRDYNASSSAYQADFALVLSQTDKGVSLAQQQYQTAKDSLTALEAMVSGIVDVRDAVLTVADAIKATGALAPKGSGDIINSAYTSLLGRTPDQGGFDYWSALLATGMTADQLRASIMQSQEYLLHPHAAGLDTVPYDNYPALLHKDEAVLNSAAANQWRFGANSGNDALIAKVEEMTKELQQLRAQSAAATRAAIAANSSDHERTATTIVQGTSNRAGRASWEANNLRPKLA